MCVVGLTVVHGGDPSLGEFTSDPADGVVQEGQSVTLSCPVYELSGVAPLVKWHKYIHPDGEFDSETVEELGEDWGSVELAINLGKSVTDPNNRLSLEAPPIESESQPNSYSFQLTISGRQYLCLLFIYIFIVIFVL